MSNAPKEIIIYTDGGAEPNPGPGGYGVVIIDEIGTRELSGGYNLTTNNRMELMAAIAALESIKTPGKIKLYSDSKYLVDAMIQGWAKRWQKAGWVRNVKDSVSNVDLWERLLALCAKHQVEFNWVKGHAGDTNNERCDQLSMQFRENPSLPKDEGYNPKPIVKTPGQTKITREGQPCRKCSTPVVRKVPIRKLRSDQPYYFEYYFYCPGCHAQYMVEAAKRHQRET
ncbi:ribonuclease HI [candidate division TA06 bacterium]|nr:ribonuclease HI [candidate division TA06 bacterium]